MKLNSTLIKNKNKTISFFSTTQILLCREHLSSLFQNIFFLLAPSVNFKLKKKHLKL